MTLAFRTPPRSTSPPHSVRSQTRRPGGDCRYLDHVARYELGRYAITLLTAAWLPGFEMRHSAIRPISRQPSHRPWRRCPPSSRGKANPHIVCDLGDAILDYAKTFGSLIMTCDVRYCIETRLLLKISLKCLQFSNKSIRSQIPLPHVQASRRFFSERSIENRDSFSHLGLSYQQK